MYTKFQHLFNIDKIFHLKSQNKAYVLGQELRKHFITEIKHTSLSSLTAGI